MQLGLRPGALRTRRAVVIPVHIHKYPPKYMYVGTRTHADPRFLDQKKYNTLHKKPPPPPPKKRGGDVQNSRLGLPLASVQRGQLLLLCFVVVFLPMLAFEIAYMWHTSSVLILQPK